MKIAILTHTFPRFEGDPSAPFMQVLAEALALDNEIIIVTPFDTKIDLKNRAKFKIESYKYVYPDSLHVLGYSRSLSGDQRLKISNLILAPLLILFGTIKLIQVIRRFKVDIISAHWIVPNGFIAFLASLFTRVPYTVTIPGSDVYLASKNPIFRLMAKAATVNTEVVISDSQHYIDQLQSINIVPRNSKVIRYGVDPKRFYPTLKDEKLLKQLNIPKNEKIVLAVGRLVAKKGFKYLISAFPEILRENPSTKLLIVGTGDLETELIELAKELNIENGVIFAGSVSYSILSKYYNLADVFVMPSIKDESGNIDASPVAMMEAMCCGIPIVATKFSGSSDFIREGENGFLVDEKDDKSISKAVLSLFKIKNIKQSVSKTAYENFSSNSVAKKYINVFRTLVK